MGKLFRGAMVTVGVLLAIFIAPIMWSAITPHPYYREGICLCGHPIYGFTLYSDGSVKAGKPAQQ
jgi:hypothetical protein